MSGPIVRKYGFPNFEKIFGERGLEHGVKQLSPRRSPKPRRGEGPAKPDRPEDAADAERRSGKG